MAGLIKKMADKTISISCAFEDSEGGLKKLVINAKEFDKVFSGVAKTAASINTFKFSALAQGLDSVGSTLKGAQALMNDLSNAYSVQIEAETKLGTIMKERMSATDETIQKIKDLCSAQQNLGVVGDEVQLAGAQQISTFLTTEKALSTLIPAMNNLVAQQKGYKATGADAASIGNLLGKAMQGQTSALRRVGISFTAAEEAAVKYGTEEQRAAALAKIITNNVGEMNAALAKTPAGQLKQVENALGDIKEQIGGVISSFTPYITGLNQFVLATENVVKLGAGIKTLGENFITFMTTVQGTTVAVKALNIALKATIAGAIISGLILIVSKVREMMSATKEAKASVDALTDANKAGADASAGARAQLTYHIASIENFKGSQKEEKDLVNELNSTYGEKIGYFKTLSEWYSALIKDSDAYCKQMQQEARAKRISERMAENSRKMDELLYNDDGSRKKYDTSRKEVMVATGEREYHYGVLGSTPKYEKTLADSEKDKAQKAYNNLLAENKRLAEQLAQNTSKITMPVVGSPTVPTIKTSTGNSSVASVADKEKEQSPQGSLAYLQEQMSDLEAKLKISVDQTEISQILETKSELQKQIDVRVKYFSNFDEIQKSIDKIELDPISLNVDTSKLSTALSMIPSKFRESAKIGNSLEKNMQGIGAAASAAASAFSGLGSSLELPALDVVGVIAQAIATMISGYATASAQSASMGPWAWAAFSLAGLAQLTAIVASVKNLTAFAEGGIVSGPTMALVGEYAGAKNNPEVIAPLNKLRQLIPDHGNGGLTLDHEISIDGNKLVILLKNATQTGAMSGRRSGII